jgi:hypothetical protein
MSFRSDLGAARRALDSQPRTHLQGTLFGTIEYAERGEGQPALVCHPLLGSFDVGLRIADLYLGEGTESSLHRGSATSPRRCQAMPPSRIKPMPTPCSWTRSIFPE